MTLLNSVWDSFVAADLVRLVGWTVVHFVWQGALLGAVAAVALRLCRRHPAHHRYAVAALALLAMAAAPVLTLAVLAAPPPAGPAPAETPAVAATAGLAGGMLGVETAAAGTTPSLRAGLDRATPWIALTWLLGVGLLTARMAGGLWRVRRLQRTALASAASSWQATANTLARRLGIRRPVHVVVSRQVASPAAAGWLRPVILLPVAALAHLTPHQVEALVTHELAHVRRHDYLVNLIQTLVETALFYHPAVWWVSSRIRTEREHCCDDLVVATSGDAVGYAEALTELETWRARQAGLAVAATSGSLRRRVDRLLGLDQRPQPGPTPWVAAIALAVALGAVVGHQIALRATRPAGSMTAAAAQTQDDRPIAAPASFDWQTRDTDRFEIYYYAGLEDSLDEVEAAAEAAYDRLSVALAHDIPHRVPLILFRTRDDFTRQEIAPGADVQGISSFSEPMRNRIVVLLDAATPVARLITHELTHIFMFDLVPRAAGVTGPRSVPIWMDEGLADHMVGVWEPDDLGTIRRQVATGIAPRMSRPGLILTGRAAYVWGHAVFDYIAATRGDDGIRQFVTALRRTLVDGTGDLYPDALGLTADAFDAEFTQYLAQRFDDAR